MFRVNFHYAVVLLEKKARQDLVRPNSSDHHLIWHVYLPPIANHHKCQFLAHSINNWPREAMLKISQNGLSPTTSLGTNTINTA